jgi:adenine-specific DNA-methyltransferase
MPLATLTEPRERQAELGQFFTPAPVAAFMASLLNSLPATIRLLDAGAGYGALTAAFVSHICESNEKVRAVEATLYEVDPAVQHALLETMQGCQRACDRVGIHFTFIVHAADFIEGASARLGGDLFGTSMPGFDIAIANPPYRKISSNSRERHGLRRIGIETSNLYAGFIALIQRVLVTGGQLVAITPRSFCNGAYFRNFREDFLETLEIHRLHVFELRDAAFHDDNVLQETVVFHAIKGRRQPPVVTVSTSSGEEGGALTARTVPFNEIVHESDDGKFIHIPSGSGHASAKKVMDCLHSSLASLGVDVSTGPVVDFRLKHALRMEPQEGTVPLVYPCHFNGGSIHWPKVKSRKPDAILNNAETQRWLVASGVYLLTKRFTSKEERRRLVACVFDPQISEAEWVGFENHLNYFHAAGRGLDRDLAYGLFAFLNSTVVDQYFRRFSGHTQVNATDLRSLAYPNRKTLQRMGRGLKRLDLSQTEIDQFVEQILNAAQ